ARFFKRVSVDEMQLTFKWITHNNIVACNCNTRTRIAPVTIHGVWLGQLDRLNDFALENIKLVKLAVFGKDISEFRPHRINRKMHASRRKLYQTETAVGF